MIKKQKIVDSQKETLGERVGRLRKEKGFAQAELAQKAGTIQRIISDYERNRLRPHPEMLIRLSSALEVSTDELLGLKKVKKDGPKPSLRISQRLKKIAELPPSQQKALLKTIDTFLKGAEK